MKIYLLIAIFLHLVVHAFSLKLHEDHYGLQSYQLHFSRVRYSIGQASQTCHSYGATLATQPIPTSILNNIQDRYPVSGDIWINNDDLTCLTIKQECVLMSSSAFGAGRCKDVGWITENTDCGSRKRYILCSKGPPTTTTTTSTTTQPTTSTTTRSTSTTRAQSTHQMNGLKSDGMSDMDDAGFGESMYYLYMSVERANKDLLGLIIGTVMGTFLIIMLIAVMCCACQGSSPMKVEKYELVESNGTDSASPTSDTSYTSDSADAADTNTNGSFDITISTHDSNREDHSHAGTITPNPSDIHIIDMNRSPNSSSCGTDDIYATLNTLNKHRTTVNPLFQGDNSPHSSPSTPRKIRPLITSIELPAPPPPLGFYNQFIHNEVPEHVEYEPNDFSRRTPPETIEEERESEEDETCIKPANSELRYLLNNTLQVKPIIHSHPDTPPTRKLVSTFF